MNTAKKYYPELLENIDEPTSWACFSQIDDDADQTSHLSGSDIFCPTGQSNVLPAPTTTTTHKITFVSLPTTEQATMDDKGAPGTSIESHRCAATSDTRQLASKRLFRYMLNTITAAGGKSTRNTDPEKADSCSSSFELDSRRMQMMNESIMVADAKRLLQTRSRQQKCSGSLQSATINVLANSQPPQTVDHHKRPHVFMYSGK